MADPRNKFTQSDDDTPFGRHLKEVTRYLNIGVTSFTGTYIATLPEEERWMIQVQVPGRTFMPVTKPIDFSFDAPTWSLGKSMAAHIAMGRIGEVYHKDLKDTIYQICGRRDEQWEMIRTRKDKSIEAYIHELNWHICRYKNQMRANMIDTKKVMTRNMELEQELKFTSDGYEEEIAVLLKKNEDLKKKLGIFMGDPAPRGDEHPKDYIIIDDTDSDPDSDDDYEDEAGVDIMESSSNQNF